MNKNSTFAPAKNKQWLAVVTSLWPSFAPPKAPCVAGRALPVAPIVAVLLASRPTSSCGASSRVATTSAALTESAALVAVAVAEFYALSELSKTPWFAAVEVDDLFQRNAVLRQSAHPSVALTSARLRPRSECTSHARRRTRENGATADFRRLTTSDRKQKNQACTVRLRTTKVPLRRVQARQTTKFAHRFAQKPPAVTQVPQASASGRSISQIRLGATRSTIKDDHAQRNAQRHPPSPPTVALLGARKETLREQAARTGTITVTARLFTDADTHPERPR